MRKNNRKNTPPHFKIFIRIQTSKIHGVGVFVIRRIKKDQYIFYGDNDELVWIDRNKVENLPLATKTLYHDFCILRSNQYGCPKNFNLITPAWFLNHSDKPNVCCDNSFRFYAIRDIRVGEELTVDYRTFTETTSDWLE